MPAAQGPLQGCPQDVTMPLAGVLPWHNVMLAKCLLLRLHREHAREVYNMS